MGRSVALRPNPYTPASVSKMKDSLCQAIVATMDSRGLSPTDVHRRYSSIRAGDLQKIRAGDGALFGVNRLVAIAEAVGIKMKLEIAA